MVNFTNQQSSPIHLENTISSLMREELNSANRFNTFREMSYDPIIGASLLFLNAVTNRPFKLEYHKDATSQEKKLTDKLNESLEQLEPYSKRDVVNNLLTMLTYGCSLNEFVYKRQDRFLVFDNISPIHLNTVRKFNFKKGKLESVELVKPDNDSLVNDTSYGDKKISGEKLLFVALNKTQDAPLGQSLLTPVWQSWKVKTVTEEYQLIGTAKQFGNILSISVPSSYINSWLTDPASEEAAYLDHLQESAALLHAGKSSHIIVPSDVFEGGQRQFEVGPISKLGNTDYEVNTTIERLSNQMLLALQTSLLQLGNTGSGSFALSESKTNLLTMVVRAIHDQISDAFRKPLKTAFELNKLPTTRLPKLVFEDVEPTDYETVSKYWQRLAQGGLITPDDNLEKFLREIGGFDGDPDYKDLMDGARKGAQLMEGSTDVDNERIEKEG